MANLVRPNPRTAELTLVRIFEAPLEIVWKAWTDARHIAAWWGPEGFTNPECEWDARVGGKLRIVMRANDEIAAAIGKRNAPMHGEFTEVVPQKKLVFTNIATDDDGNTQLDGTTTVTFDDLGSRTRVTLRAEVKGLTPMSEQMIGGMEAGWSQSLDKLGRHLSASR